MRTANTIRRRGGIMPMAIRLTARRNSAMYRADSSTGLFLPDTPVFPIDQIAAREEEHGWHLKHHRPATLHNGFLIAGKPSKELAWLMRFAAGTTGVRWSGIRDRLITSGVPVGMPRGNLAGETNYEPGQALAAVTGGTANVAWWAPATYSQIPQLSLQAPVSFKIHAGGLITSSAASQTITMNPAIGTAVAGQALGASAALALGSTITNAFWRLDGDVIVRTATTAGTAIGNFDIEWGTSAGATPGTPTATNPSNALFGGGNTVATADFQGAAQGILIAATPSATGVSVTPQYVISTNLD